ncbi:chloride channel protein [Kaistia nematophila]|uniref:Chloride channel protein n=1 Tax=Kaistia nematophila TaxID=2994654 RepID=A0A9X3DZZ4_9HYPH|nr:chloride channel protein [Kaistia nematophila]MCX5568433.1 chloride channel protein [Kaistia nematophila]
MSRARALIRTREPSLLIVAALIGSLAGIAVTVMSRLAQWLHVLLFDIAPDGYLSASALISPPWRAAATAGGGLLLGALYLLFFRRARQIVDPIEANALHGGRMSLRDSLRVAVEAIISNGSGASVGLEAGYTQVGSAIASRLGQRLHLRRTDLRTVVGCGAAGAIAAAFSAPLTGAFYGFELIIGVYTVANIAPVMTASIAGFLVAQGLGAAAYSIEVPNALTMHAADYPPYLVLGVVAGFAAIGIMRLVTLVELAFQKSRLPRAIRPAVGGAIIGALALYSPQVLAAGHGAMHLNLVEVVPVGLLLTVLALKIAGVSISLGSGFRGGMFFASLFLGVIVGKLFAMLVTWLAPSAGVDPIAAAIVGMSALGVGIVGGPLTMTFLALEATGDLAITGIVLAASILSAITVREFFGYSFSTWRLHLRGETIRSAIDVGWLRGLTVGRMMRTDVRSVLATMPVDAFRSLFPLGSTQRVIVTDTSGRYAGIILVAEIHSTPLPDEAEDATIQPFCRQPDKMLFPNMSAQTAAKVFDEAESEELVVVDDASSRHVVGLLTEAHLFRRYAEELDKARRSLAGEG